MSIGFIFQYQLSTKGDQSAYLSSFYRPRGSTVTVNHKMNCD